VLQLCDNHLSCTGFGVALLSTSSRLLQCALFLRTLLVRPLCLLKLQKLPTAVCLLCLPPLLLDVLLTLVVIEHSRLLLLHILKLPSPVAVASRRWWRVRLHSHTLLLLLLLPHLTFLLTAQNRMVLVFYLLLLPLLVLLGKQQCTVLLCYFLLQLFGQCKKIIFIHSCRAYKRRSQ
jgi:hypothetical protein